MKKIYILLASLALLTGCDDGDMSFKALNFENFSAPARCNTESNTVYLTNGSEALILTLPSTVFLNVPSSKDSGGNYIPTEVLVGSGSNTMYYRNYSGNVNSGTLCQSSGTPNLLEQWTANGRLLITTTENRTDGKLTGYSHQIVVESATLNKGDQEITIVNNLLGSFTTAVNIDFDFDELTTGESSVPRKCSSGKQYKINDSFRAETLELQIPASYFADGQSKSINLVNNPNDDIFLYFNVYERNVDASVVCATDNNNIPNKDQVWLVRSGILEITYESENSRYVMRFRNLVFYNNNSSTETFTPLDNDQSDEAGLYWFGPYVP